MTEASQASLERVADALQAEESGPLDQIVRSRRVADRDVLRRIVTDELAIEAPRSQQKAIYALGRWGDPNLGPILEQVLPTLDAGGRIAALDALSRGGEASAIGVIVRYASDDSDQVRKMVVTALTRIDGDDAEAHLDRMADTDPAGWVRDLAGDALRRRRS